MASHVEIVEVRTAKHLDMFVRLPFCLYSGDSMWVPPLVSDEKRLLNPSCNPAFDHCESLSWIALCDGKCVGRVSAIINGLLIAKMGRNVGRVSRFECIDDVSVARALLNVAESWLSSHGMEEACGPLGFTNLDHQGVLVEGFDYLPSVASDFSKPYYARLFAECGYVKAKDWLEFRIDVPRSLPEKSLRVEHALCSRSGLRVISFSSKKELVAYAPRIFSLFNVAFRDLYGCYALPPALQQFYIEKYMPVLSPRYVKVVEDSEGSLVGFIIALPSLSKAMQHAGGRLFPFGWWHIRRAFSHPQVVDLLLTGVRPDMQRFGVAALLMNALWQVANEDGVRFVESTAMLEDNHVAIQMWKNFSHIQHKRKRVFSKQLIN